MRRLVGREVILEFAGLSKRFGGLQAVDNVSFGLEEGKITGLIGPNGAGKTTIYNLVTGAIQLDSGKVLLRGEDVTGKKPTNSSTRVLLDLSRTSVFSPGNPHFRT